MTVIYPSPIFGPVHSRRLGVSLGINLLPEDGKVCTFDCIYCECGFNSDHRPKKPLPTREEVRAALEARLQDMQKNGPVPDVLTFAGNGEPTAHPHFPEIIEDRKIDVIFIPSIWPETFSYTSQEAIEMGMPVAVFDLGAPPERVKKYEKGLVIDKIDAAYALEKIRGMVI